MLQENNENKAVKRDFNDIDEHNKAIHAYRGKFGKDPEYSWTTEQIYDQIKLTFGVEDNLANVKNALADGKSMQSEEQFKQSQMTENAGTINAGQSENPGTIDSNPNLSQQSFEDYLKKFEPHQQRVVLEAKELGEKVYALRTFIGQSPIFKDLCAEEKETLKVQLFHMEQYLSVLQTRIYVWEGGNWGITKGKELISDFGVDNEAVFILKYLAALYIDKTNVLGVDPRRNNIVATDMEKVQMMAVKSVFSKRV